MKNPDIERVNKKRENLLELILFGGNPKLHSAITAYSTAAGAYTIAAQYKSENSLKRAREWEAVGDWVLKMKEGEK